MARALLNFVRALLNLIKLVSTWTCSLARVRAGVVGWLAWWDGGQRGSGNFRAADLWSKECSLVKVRTSEDDIRPVAQDILLYIGKCI